MDKYKLTSPEELRAMSGAYVQGIALNMPFDFYHPTTLCFLGPIDSNEKTDKEATTDPAGWRVCSECDGYFLVRLMCAFDANASGSGSVSSYAGLNSIHLILHFL